MSAPTDIGPELRRIVETGDPLATVYRELIGKSAQVRIPLTDVVGLRHVATALRVLASRLEVLSQEQREPHRVLLSARLSIQATQRALTRDRRPR